MAAINVTNKVMKAWYEMLHGHLSVPVYRVDAPVQEEGNFVLLRMESESDNTNNSKFVTNPVLITEVITKFAVAIKDGLAANIDSEIATLLFPSVGQLGLPSQSDIEITSVVRQNATFLPEDDGTFRYHRLLTRNKHRVVQVASNGLGAELITNGGFIGSAAGWQLGNSWIYNTNKVSFVGGSIDDVKQAGLLTEGAMYRVSFTITGSNGYVLARLANGSYHIAYAVDGNVSFDGLWSNVSEGFKIIFTPSSLFDGSITNVSVKEIL